jgi:hypothetical protein
VARKYAFNPSKIGQAALSVRVTRVLLSVTVTADRVWSGIHIAETENMVSNRTDRDFNYH